MPHVHHDIPATDTVVYATAESANTDYLHQATGCPVVASARELSGLEQPNLVVVPACTGRDLTSITQAAQALQWMKQQDPQRTVLLGEALSGATYAIARMRHHIRRLAASADAILFVSATVDPFADAELLRRVRLARQYSENVEVSVAFDDAASAPSVAWPRPEDELGRWATLGFHNVAQVRADLHYDPAGQQQPLFKNMGMREAVEAAARNARHRAEHGDDGLAQGLLADHGTGFAHSHGEHSHGGHSHSGHSHGGHSHSH